MPPAIPAQISFLVEKSLGPWLSVWAIRHKWNLDYKLNANARLVRWGLVILCYFSAAVSGVAGVRLSGVFLGLVFLCWPNFAYHLTRIFEIWPSTIGTVNSSRVSGSTWSISYSFELNGQQYGGTSICKPLQDLNMTSIFPPGGQVTVSYDPLNPDKSMVKQPVPHGTT